MDRAPVSKSRVCQLNSGRLAELVLESATDFAIFTADLDEVITSWNGAAWLCPRILAQWCWRILAQLPCSDGVILA
jgi:hypothetical protein